MPVALSVSQFRLRVGRSGGLAGSPEGVGCCGFAGDRGFTFPELNKYGLRKLRPQIEANHIEVGYSNSRTCEIGLETNTGIPYMSIVYLVNECTTAKKEL